MNDNLLIYYYNRSPTKNSVEYDFDVAKSVKRKIALGQNLLERIIC